VLLERAHEGVLVLRRLEATVAELGAGVDELQLDVLQSLTLGVNQKRLEKGISVLPPGKQSRSDLVDDWSIREQNQTNALTS
jgi:hypothetical protein